MNETTATTRVWLITGCSSGLGLTLITARPSSRGSPIARWESSLRTTAGVAAKLHVLPIARPLLSPDERPTARRATLRRRRPHRRQSVVGTTRRSLSRHEHPHAARAPGHTHQLHLRRQDHRLQSRAGPRNVHRPKPSVGKQSTLGHKQDRNMKIKRPSDHPVTSDRWKPAPRGWRADLGNSFNGQRRPTGLGCGTPRRSRRRWSRSSRACRSSPR